MGEMGGFRNTPVTKAAIIVSVVLTFFNTAIKARFESKIDLLEIFQGAGLWYLFVFPVAYSNTGQMLLGSFLFYKFRVLERFLGSYKYGMLIFLSIAFGLPIVGATSLYFTRSQLASGPLIPLYSSLILYYGFVPAKKPKMIGICGIDFSEKSITYLLCFQLFFSTGVFWQTCVGAAFGCLYASDLIPLQSFRPPAFIINAFSIIQTRRQVRSGPITGRVPITGNRMALLPSFRVPLYNHQQRVPDFSSDNLIPSEENIATLEALGFDRATAIGALQRTGSNVERAAHSLLESHIEEATQPSRNIDESGRHHED